jgi:pimeloyl-ACP methyl ester carboxylesterase
VREREGERERERESEHLNIQTHALTPTLTPSTLRHFPLGELRAEIEAVGRREFPILLIWGSQDVVCPFAANSAPMQQLLGKNCELLAVPNSGHLCFLDDPQNLVLPRITGFLSAVAAPPQRQ